MIDGRVRMALRARLLTVIDDDLLAKENESFTPPRPQRTPWFRETLLPGIPTRVEIMRDGETRTRGVYQVDVFVPAGEGTVIPDELAKMIVDAFPQGSTHSSDGLTVNVRRSYPQSARSAGDWYMQPVVIDWWVKN